MQFRSQDLATDHDRPTRQVCQLVIRYINIKLDWMNTLNNIRMVAGVMMMAKHDGHIE